MVNIQRIEREKLEFPDTEQALSYPNGLLAVGGDLSIERLLHFIVRVIASYLTTRSQFYGGAPIRVLCSTLMSLISRAA